MATVVSRSEPGSLSEPPHGCRISRLIRLFALLQSQLGHTASQLAEMLDVTRRTIFRDVKALRDAGLDIRFDQKRRGLALFDHSSHNGPALTNTELSLLIMAARMSPLWLDKETHIPIARGVAKLVNSASSSIRHQVTDFLASCHVRDSVKCESSLNNGCCAQLLAAMARRRQVWLCLETDASESSVRRLKFEPYYFSHTDSEWCVVGWCRKSERSSHFLLKQILEVDLTDRLWENSGKKRRLSSWHPFVSDE